MVELTPRNFFPFPSERDQPFFDTFKSGEIAKDASIFANADNSNIQFMGGGNVSWDATTELLFWTSSIQVNGFHSSFGGTIPTGSVFIESDEVIFFTMPRLVQAADSPLTLFRSSRIFAEGVRLNDLRLFVTRKGSTLYFSNGLSLKDGDTGTLFGQGLQPLPSVIPHEHQPSVTFVAPSAGIIVISPMPLIISPDLAVVEVYKNGLLLVNPDDYIVDLGTGVITLVQPTVVVPNPDRYVIWRETRDTTVTVSSHQHAAKLILKPTPGTSVLNALVTSPFLLRVDVFRNGSLLVEGATDDYTVDLGTGQITLSTPSAAGDKFELARELAI